MALGVLVLAPMLRAADPNADLDRIPPLRPLQPELPASFWEQHSWLVLLGSGLAVAVVAVAGWWLTRPKPEVVIPPATRARQALEGLGRQTEDGLLLSRVSQVLRHYISTAFALPPGELTTTEFCAAIATHERIGPQLSLALADFLRRCDERKFAPEPPGSPLGAAGQALRFVEEAEARLGAKTEGQSTTDDGKQVREG